MAVYVKSYKTSQELVVQNEDPVFTGELNLNIVTHGSDTDKQERIKEHILKEIKRICSELSTPKYDQLRNRL